MLDVPLTLEGWSNRNNVVWRFYVDEHGGWRWQQLGSDRSVLADSAGAHATYDVCVSDAKRTAIRSCGLRQKWGCHLARTHISTSGGRCAARMSRARQFWASPIDGGRAPTDAHSAG